MPTLAQRLAQEDPLLAAAILQTGTPAAIGLMPPSQEKASLYDTLAALATWMGMALPGRGGLGRVAPPYPMRTTGRTPKQTEDLGKLVDQGFRDWMRENVTGKVLPSKDPIEGILDAKTRRDLDFVSNFGSIESEQDLYGVLLSELFASQMAKMAPRAIGFDWTVPRSASAPGRGEALRVPGMPIYSPSIPVDAGSARYPLFWLVE